MATLDHLFLIILAVAVIIEGMIVLAGAPRVTLFVTLAIGLCVALQVDPSLTVGTFRVALADVFCVTLVGGTAIRQGMRKAAVVPGAVIVLGSLVVLAILRGASEFGLKPAVNEAREVLYLVAAMAFFSTVPCLPRFIASFRRAWLCAGALLVGLAVIHWTRTGFGTLASHAVSGRALTGAAALIVLEAAVVTLVFPVGRGGSKWIAPSVCLLVVALSAQRTVWIAACVGLPVLLVSAIRVGERKSSALTRTILVIVGSVFALLLIAGPGTIDTTLGGASGSSFSQGGTFAWRFAGWQQLVGGQLKGSAENLLVGNPAGHGFARVIDNQQVVVAAHSEYVTALVSLGVLGLLVLMALLVSLVKALQRRARSQDVTDRRAALLFLTLVAIEAVQFVSYSSGLLAGIVLGVAVAASRGTRPGEGANAVSLRPGIAEIRGAPTSGRVKKMSSRRARPDQRAPNPLLGIDRISPASELKRLAVHGFVWTGGAMVVGLGVQLAYTATMARLVRPAAFGLIAAAGVLISILGLVSEFGLKSAVMQRQDVDAADVRCAFTYSVLFGLTTTIAAFLLSSLAAKVMGISALGPLVRVLSLSLLITSLGVVAEATLRRDLRYRTVALVDVAAMACGFLLVGVPLAIAGANEWSLIFAQLSYTSLDALALMLIARHSLVPIFSWDRARRFVLFGGGVSGLSLFEYAGSNLDTVGVSRYLGPTELGQYSRATLLFSLPAYKATIAVSSVLFPALARIQASPERIRTTLQQALGGVTMLVVPAAIVAGVAAPGLVRMVLGPSWGPAAQVLPMLALASALALVTHVISVTFEAVGRLQEKFLIQVGRVSLFAAALAGVVIMGPTLPRFAVAWLCVQVLEYLAYVVAARVRLGSSIQVMTLQLARAVGTGVVCASPSLLVVRLAGETGLFGCTIAGLGAGAFFLALWRTPLLVDARDVLQSLREGMRKSLVPVPSLRVRFWSPRRRPGSNTGSWPVRRRPSRLQLLLVFMARVMWPASQMLS